MSEQMTREELDEIRRACEGATLEPWRAVEKGNTVRSHAVKTVAFDGKASVHICCGISPKSGNAEFIALSSTAVPRLLAEVDRLKAALDAAVRMAKSAESDLIEAKQDIRDMLYESELLMDDALCLWCEKYSEPHKLCWAQDCKAECKWRGPCAANSPEQGGEGK